MTWTELLAQAADFPARAQAVLDAALEAVAVADNAVLDAEITAQLLTPAGLCAVLDAFAVQVPGEVAARVTWYATRPPSSTSQRESMPQDLQIAKHAAI